MAIAVYQAEDNPEMTGDMAGYRLLAGHCLEVREDDWQPGSGEKNNPRFKFVQLPGPASDWLHLIEEPAKKPDGMLPMRRVVKLDMVALEAETKKTEKVDATLGAVTEIAKADFDKKIVDAEIGEIVVSP